jgi:hypothetical protein
VPKEGSPRQWNTPLLTRKEAIIGWASAVVAGAFIGFCIRGLLHV